MSKLTYLSKLPPCFLNVLNVAVEGVCVLHKKWGEGNGVGLVHDKPKEGTIEYWTRSCPFHKGLGKGVGNKKRINRIRGLIKICLLHDDHSLLQHGGTQCKENSIKGLSTYIDRVQSSVWRLPNYGPPTPLSAQRVCPPPKLGLLCRGGYFLLPYNE